MVNGRAISEATAFAPATISNIGMGFDVLGMAVAGPGDTATVTLERGGEGVEVVSIEGDDGKAPREAEKNTAAIAARATLARANVRARIRLSLVKGMPIGSGLGSSAASAAAGALATNLAMGSPLRKADLIGPCLEAEQVVAGRHADNIAPSLLGGLILVRSVDPVEVIRLPIPDGLYVAVTTPAVEVLTKDARAALPREVGLETLVRTTADIAGFVSACYTNDVDLLSTCIVDRFAAPSRMGLIPGGAEAIEAAERAGALGASISGAGPSIFALCRSEESASHAAAAMGEAFEARGIMSSSIVSAGDCPGARAL